MTTTNQLVLIIGIASVFFGHGFSHDIQRDPNDPVISTKKGAWTELTLTLQNTGPEVAGNNISLNGRCIQGTVNNNYMRIQCKDSEVTNSGALCYSYQILFQAQKNINIGLCIYTLGESGKPLPTKYPQYRIKVIESEGNDPTSSNGITSGNIGTTDWNKIEDKCASTIIPILATILGLFVGVSVLGNAVLLVCLCKKPPQTKRQASAMIEAQPTQPTIAPSIGTTPPAMTNGAEHTNSAVIPDIHQTPTTGEADIPGN